MSEWSQILGREEEEREGGEGGRNDCRLKLLHFKHTKSFKDQNHFYIA